MALHVRYFVRPDGEILLPPTDDIRCPAGAMELEANTLPEIDALHAKLQAQTWHRLEMEAVRDEFTFGAKRREIRDSLTAKLSSAATSDYEKEFIKLYLQISDEEKRKKYQQRFACDTAYFELREFDKPRTPEEIIGEKL